MNEMDLREMNGYFWWHRIRLPDGTYTPGICPHGVTDIESRFGLPKDMTGKTVLDVGAWDGLFSFEAERRGAKFVKAIDIYQTCKGQSKTMFQANKPFLFAKNKLNSNVSFSFNTLENFKPTLDTSITEEFDYIFYFGVMYHIENPLAAVKKLLSLSIPNGTILVETTISTNSNLPMLEYRPGFEDDPTNQFYPTKEWVELAFMTHGAKSVEMIWTDKSRASFKIST